MPDPSHPYAGAAIMSSSSDDDGEDVEVVEQPIVQQEPFISTKEITEAFVYVAQQLYNVQNEYVTTWDYLPSGMPLEIFNTLPIEAQNEYIYSAKAASYKLRKNLINAGQTEPEYWNAAHHIVAGRSAKAAEARTILAEFGIGINDAVNGVFYQLNKVWLMHCIILRFIRMSTMIMSISYWQKRTMRKKQERYYKALLNSCLMVLFQSEAKKWLYGNLKQMQITMTT